MGSHGFVEGKSSLWLPMVLVFASSHSWNRTCGMGLFPCRIMGNSHSIHCPDSNLDSRRHPFGFAVHSASCSDCFSSAHFYTERPGLGARNTFSALSCTSFGVLIARRAFGLPCCDRLGALHLFSILSQDALSEAGVATFQTVRRESYI